MALQSGLLKVMRGRCPNWLAERRLYRRDEKGQVIKKFDHAMDAGRYNFASGDAWLVAEPAPSPDEVQKCTIESSRRREDETLRAENEARTDEKVLSTMRKRFRRPS
jgi:hypothetical protein